MCQDENDRQPAKQVGQSPYSLRYLADLVLMLGVLLLLLVKMVTSSAQDAAPRFVNSIVIDGTINPAVAEFICESIHAAYQDGARALVIQLDTPGGLLSSTHAIVKDILGASLPVIVYVALSGASAGSAGVFITLAAHGAARSSGPSSCKPPLTSVGKA